MATALQIAERRAEGPALARPSLFRYDPPVSARVIASWQRELDTIVEPADRVARLLIRWESGDRWQPVQRFMIWLAQDPSTVTTEPWVVRDLRRGSPRASGHYCGIGYCLCDVKKDKWVGGTTRFVDRATWEVYQETGLRAWRWWTIQGDRGGHRFEWDPEELAAKLSAMRGYPADTPAPGDRPYAPFDRRVLHAIAKERRAGDIVRAMQDASKRAAALTREERAEAEAGMKALWDWTGDQAEALWNDGAELVPRFLEERYGRVPLHVKSQIIPEAVEQACLTLPA